MGRVHNSSSSISQNSSSSISKADSEEWRRCGCGSWSPLLTAWTADNAGRRFWSCPNYQVRDCGYFEWKDGVFPEEARRALKQLVNERNLLKEKLQHDCGRSVGKEEKLREREEKLKVREMKMKEKAKNNFEKERMMQLWFHINIVITLIIFIVVVVKL